MSDGIQAVIFDLDGLLIDSEPLQIMAWREYLSGLGATLTPEVLSEMYGLRLSDASEVVVRLLELDVTPEEVARDRDGRFLDMVPGNIEPRPGAREIVQELARRGVPIALATSGHRFYVDLAIESAAIPRIFTVEVTGEMVQRGKPDPETFVTAAELMGIEPSACLVLEDSPNGVRAAKRAGMHCIAIPNDDTSGLDVSMADVVMKSLDDVLPWIDARDSAG
jgi:HAD superfamily hydrolase (TIGR01509 family)